MHGGQRRGSHDGSHDNPPVHISVCAFMVPSKTPIAHRSPSRQSSGRGCNGDELAVCSVLPRSTGEAVSITFVKRFHSPSPKHWLPPRYHRIRPQRTSSSGSDGPGAALHLRQHDVFDKAAPHLGDIRIGMRFLEAKAVPRFTRRIGDTRNMSVQPARASDGSGVAD
jgi:hypothetical protein